MGYTIRYENKGDKVIYRNGNKHFRYTWLIVLAGIILASIALTKSTDMETIKEWLIPGNPVVTEEAVHDMILNLQNGLPVSEAFSHFCLRIIQG